MVSRVSSRSVRSCAVQPDCVGLWVVRGVLMALVLVVLAHPSLLY